MSSMSISTYNGARFGDSLTAKIGKGKDLNSLFSNSKEDMIIKLINDHPSVEI